ncbi:MAG TPA: hypothetical protein VN914_20585 [Polyangia bacterium]|nr:hypothetical protein [Polyangia bacterium]
MIAESLDGRVYELIHHAPAERSLAVVPVGEMESVDAEELRRACREVVLASLDAFPARRRLERSAYDRMDDDATKRFHREHRMVSAGGYGPNVEFAPWYLEKNGTLDGCDRSQHVVVSRDAGNEAFVRAMERALARVRGWPPRS